MASDTIHFTSIYTGAVKATAATSWINKTIPAQHSVPRAARCPCWHKNLMTSIKTRQMNTEPWTMNVANISADIARRQGPSVIKPITVYNTSWKLNMQVIWTTIQSWIIMEYNIGNIQPPVLIKNVAKRYGGRRTIRQTDGHDGDKRRFLRLCKSAWKTHEKKKPKICLNTQTHFNYNSKIRMCW